MALKTMSILKLQDLKAQVDAAIAEKVSERRHELESELSKLSSLDGTRKGKATRGGPRGAVAPKCHLWIMGTVLRSPANSRTR